MQFALVKIKKLIFFFEVISKYQILKSALSFREKMYYPVELGEYMTIPVFVVFLVFAIPVSWIDIRTYRIPDMLIFSGSLVIFIFLLIAETISIPNRLSAAVLSGLFFFIVRKITGGLGLGDVKFAFLIGLCCGLPWVCAAFLCAALLGILGLLAVGHTGKNTFHRAIPFAPFLTAGVIVSYTLSHFFIFDFF
jgi:prepilin signal peptidase PulO-like enzyme (type II secretory pathway)